MTRLTGLDAEVLRRLLVSEHRVLADMEAQLTMAQQQVREFRVLVRAMKQKIMMTERKLRMTGG